MRISWDKSNIFLIIIFTSITIFSCYLATSVEYVVRDEILVNNFMSSGAKSFKILPSELNYWPESLFDMDEKYVISKKLDSLGSLVGVFANYELQTVPEMQEGRFFTKDDFLDHKDYAVIGQRHMRDTETIEGKRFFKIDNKAYEVIGIIKNRKDHDWTDYRCYINLKSVVHDNNLLWAGSFEVDAIKDKDSFYKKLEGNIKNEGFNIENSTQENSSSLSELFSNMRIIIFLFLVILFIFIINTISITTAWLGNKHKELGVKKCFGANNIHICLDVVRSLFFIGLISFVIGLILYSFISLFLNGSIQIYFHSLIISFLIISVTSIVTSIAPVIRTFEIQPAEMLR